MIFQSRKGLFSNECLWKSDLFADRDPRFVELLSRDVKVEVFKPGDTIVKEGSRGSSMYILRRGEVEVIVRGIPVSHLSSGSVFGEITMLGATDRRTATVKATEFSDCRVVHRKYMTRLLQLFPRERDFFESLARERLVELQAQGAASRRRTERNSVKAVGTEAVTRECLPEVNSKGFDDRGYRTALSEFSRFFEKPTWRSGQFKKNCLDSPVRCDTRHMAVELPPAVREKPPLPPMITRTLAPRDPQTMEDTSEVDTPSQDESGSNSVDGHAAKGGWATKGSRRGGETSRTRCFKYGKAKQGLPEICKDVRRF